MLLFLDADCLALHKIKTRYGHATVSKRTTLANQHLDVVSFINTSHCCCSC